MESDVFLLLNHMPHWPHAGSGPCMPSLFSSLAPLTTLRALDLGDLFGVEFEVTAQDSAVEGFSAHLLSALTGLMSLSLDRCPGVTRDALLRVTARCTSLRTLCLKGCIE